MGFDFKIDRQDVEDIEKAVKLLIVKENTCIQKIRNMRLERAPEKTDSYCTWSVPLIRNP